MGRRHIDAAKAVQVEPCTYDEAMAEVVARHRRRGRLPRVQVRLCLRAHVDGRPVGYAVIGVPCARAYVGRLEVRRIVSWGWGAASALYRAAAAAGADLTYTDADEPGHSLRAAGWTVDARLRPARGKGRASQPGRQSYAPAWRIRWRAP